MPWDKGRGPNNPKYRSKAHLAERAKYVKAMRDNGYLICQQPICVEPERTIDHGQPWHLGHADDGIAYIGPVHPSCNVKDGARRGRARQEQTDLTWLQDEEPPQPWLRKDYHPCPACGHTVVWASQRCCSRACSTSLKRKPKPPPPQPKTVACAICGDTFTAARGATYCSDPCRVEKNRRVQRDLYRSRMGLPTNPDQPTSKWVSGKQSAVF